MERWTMKRQGFRTRLAAWVSCLAAAMTLLCIPHAYAADMWVSAYYGGWAQGCGYIGNMQADKIDYSAVTHVIHFAIQPLPDGSIDDTALCITPVNSASLVTQAHAAGKKVLVALGGEYTEAAFLSATNGANRQKFIRNIVNFITTRGYDGIDFDWEPVSPSSASQVRTFVNELTAALDALTPRPLLTAAVVWEPELFAEMQDKFDQLNIMTYDLNGNWLNGSWFNAPTYDGGYWFPASGPAPSADGLVDMFISAGVKAEKLGIGIGFYGYVAKGGTGTSTGGVTAPGQFWTTPPEKTVYTYYDIMDKFYEQENYRYDSAAGSPYLSFDEPGSGEDMFITFDDESSIREKIKYVRNKQIGGVIIFQLGGGWRPDQPVPDNLLQAVKDNVALTAGHEKPLPPTLSSPSDLVSNVALPALLQWVSSEKADTYAVQVARNASFTDLIVDDKDIPATYASFAQLGLNTMYYWRVRAANAAGSSEWSAVWSFTTEEVGTVVADFSVTAVQTGVLLTWQTLREYQNKGFEVQRRLSTSGRWSKIGFVAGAGTSSDTRGYSFTDAKGLRRNYIYRLKQLNKDGSHVIIQR
jgi:chitinase